MSCTGDSKFIIKEGVYEINLISIVYILRFLIELIYFKNYTHILDY